ncbi:dihydrofolate reductase [Desertivirga xinjiangensis]|uniref:dihydrofolate reductase n=1 Tax=Desertivirga xinjiangensis TaxID=539206 RepID=UPI00210D3319|nr:dihydrofolate reductase [Pedobacter xinjiangensis]
MSKIISAVVVVDANNGIGKENKLLVHFPADLKRFKNITTGHSIVMGRKTFDSMGRALPNRRNIVISRQADLVTEGAEIARSLEEALNLCRDEDEVFIIGGAEIFKQAFAITDRIYLTRIHKSFEADTFFPDISNRSWREAERTDFQPDEKTPFSYSFITYQKR